ncbi:DUF3263 domain-containing protein [Nocardioides sp. URHA0020]|uniref:DUF3263 domain-containing protein n=1 Tax=Nocardioides sp. URHA0020 TaxID=1380392 RepID=UPI0009DE8B30
MTDRDSAAVDLAGEAQPNQQDAGASETQAPEQEAGAAHDGNGCTVRVLTALEEGVLVFERSWWKYPGAKETAIRDQFDLSPTGYYQVLNALIDRPEAAAFDALTVHRLQRLRRARRDATRREQRSPRRTRGRAEGLQD